MMEMRCFFSYRLYMCCVVIELHATTLSSNGNTQVLSTKTKYFNITVKKDLLILYHVQKLFEKLKYLHENPIEIIILDHRSIRNRMKT